MNEPVTAAPPTAGKPVTTASAISTAIANKANGKAPAPGAVPSGDQKPADSQPDVNAGKEKYVVDGKEVWLSPEQARSYVQKGLAFEPRMDQLARLQQETVQFQRALLNDPGKVLTNLANANKVPIKDLVQKILNGSAPDEIKETVGQWFYETAVEPMKLTPEQLKAREDAKWRAEHEKTEKQRQDDAVRQENQAKVNKAMTELKTFIGEAMKESGLPDNDTPLGAEMARMVADTMRITSRQGKSITPKQAIEFVKQRIKAVQAAYYDHLDEEKLVAEIGEKNAEKVQKYFLKKAQANNGQAPNGKPAARRSEKNGMTRDETLDYFDSLKRQR